MIMTIEPGGEKLFDPCTHCGNCTRQVWGYVYADGHAHAVYFIRWTDGHVDEGATIAISIGGWGEGSNPADKVCIGVACRLVETGPGYMVIDAGALPWKDLGEPLDRSSVVNQPIAQQVFAIVDEIADQDPRFAAFLRPR